MEDDVTLPVPKPTPVAGDGLASDDVTIPLSPGARRAGSAERSAPKQGWLPPSVEEMQKLLPQYHVSRFLARGGMGAVYEGVQKSLERRVAIKILPPDIEDNDIHFAERFKAEARAMARLAHPGIVTVFDAGETAGGLLYFVMELVEGTDVAQMVSSEGRLSAVSALKIITQVCEALGFAHEEGIIHRDIKPSNIMVDRKGRVKVADFGLAKVTAQETGGFTKTNTALGTPDFIAPEALMPGMQVDQRADLYAVGVMLYQMLTGHVPRGRFLLPSFMVPEIDPRLDAIVDKAMQTDRERRYSTAIEMKTDVELFSQEKAKESRFAVPAHAQSPAGVGPAKSRKLILLGLSAAALMVIGAVVWISRPDSEIQSKAASTTQTGSARGQALPIPEKMVVQSPGASLGASGEVHVGVDGKEANVAVPTELKSKSSDGKADAVWKSRWSKPGRLRAIGIDDTGKPIDLHAAEPYSDFVQVMNLSYNASRGSPNWLALRENGEVLWSNGKVEKGFVGLAGSSTRIMAGGKAVSTYLMSPPESVMSIQGSTCLAAVENPVITVWQKMDASWQVASPGFTSGSLMKPDLTSPPAVKMVMAQPSGVGVLRVDGSFRLWGARELRLPPAVTMGVREIAAIGGQWGVLNEDGNMWFLKFGLPDGAGVGPSFDATAISAGKSADAIASAGFSLIYRQRDKMWVPLFEATAEMHAAFRLLFEQGIEHFSAASNMNKASLIWIEPMK
jgi:serine/threonine protein kinase